LISSDDGSVVLLLLVATGCLCARSWYFLHFTTHLNEMLLLLLLLCGHICETATSLLASYLEPGASILILFWGNYSRLMMRCLPCVLNVNARLPVVHRVVHDSITSLHTWFLFVLLLLPIVPCHRRQRRLFSAPPTFSPSSSSSSSSSLPSLVMVFNVVLFFVDLHCGIRYWKAVSIIWLSIYNVPVLQVAVLTHQ